jgi:phytoene dehydrogenase-like protein
MPRAEYDIAIVGAGPNGLTAAAYLARSGARVALLEKRFERGGTFASDDYSTPFLYNLAQFELPLGEELPPYRDLELGARGVSLIQPDHPFSVQAEPRGEELVIGRGGQGLGAEVEEMFAAVSDAVTPLLYDEPRDEEEVLADAGAAGAAAAALASEKPRTLACRADDPRASVALRYACGLAGFLDSDQRLGLIGGFAVARLFSPTIVVGGTKNLANALAREAAAAGARGFVSSEVTRLEAGGGPFRVRTGDGREIRARAVVSTLDPRSTFLGVAAELAPAELREAAAGWTLDETGPYTAHFGIKGEPPRPAGRDGSEALVRIFGFAGPDDVDERFAAVLRGELPSGVAGHLTVVTAHDPMQASPGPYGPLNTLRLQAMVPFEHPDEPWDRVRTAYREACWEAAARHFDGLDAARLLFQFSDTPPDLERRFATTRRGSVRQGSLTAGQTLTRRPHASCSSGRTPVPGLYLGGGAVHPGVPGCLGGGYRAATLVAEDHGFEPWWAAMGLTPHARA